MKVNKDQILAFQLPFHTRPSAQGASYSIESLLELAEDDSVGSWNGWMLTQTSVFQFSYLVLNSFWNSFLDMKLVEMPRTDV